MRLYISAPPSLRYIRKPQKLSIHFTISIHFTFLAGSNETGRTAPLPRNKCWRRAFVIRVHSSRRAGIRGQNSSSITNAGNDRARLAMQETTKSTKATKLYFGSSPVPFFVLPTVEFFAGREEL